MFHSVSYIRDMIVDMMVMFTLAQRSLFHWLCTVSSLVTRSKWFDFDIQAGLCTCTRARAHTHVWLVPRVLPRRQ